MQECEPVAERIAHNYLLHVLDNYDKINVLFINIF